LVSRGRRIISVSVRIHTENRIAILGAVFLRLTGKKAMENQLKPSTDICDQRYRQVVHQPRSLHKTGVTFEGNNYSLVAATPACSDYNPPAQPEQTTWHQSLSLPSHPHTPCDASSINYYPQNQLRFPSNQLIPIEYAYKTVMGPVLLTLVLISHCQ